MGVFDIFSSAPKKSESVVLIDIGTTTITGAYVHYSENELPALVYTKTIDIEAHDGEREEDAMVRALKSLGETVIKEGAPILSRVTGSGTARIILVSIDAPWQETTVHTENFEEAEPFVFTQSLVTKRLEERRDKTPDKALVDESIVGTILNGYETDRPYGKKAHRASVVVMTSFIEREVAALIVTTLERLFHSNNVLPIAGSSLRYQAMREAFPHEHDAILLDATNPELSSISLVRKDLIVSLVQSTTPSKIGEWAATVTGELAEMAKQHPLPRTIFLLAREAQMESLSHELDSVNVRSLWLSDNSPKIIPVLPTYLSSSVRQLTDVPSDIVILLMSLYFAAARERHENF